jgi:hypothetical protein
MQESNWLVHDLNLISFSDYKFIFYTCSIYSIKFVRLEVSAIGNQAYVSCPISMFNLIN